MIENRQQDFVLTESDLNQLLGVQDLPSSISGQLQDIVHSQGSRASLALSQQDAKLLRDILIEEMAVRGFDQNDRVTTEGRFIENLIDRLWLICSK